ncbi:CPBP family glutamic-type intramembrane protease [Anaerorhabdus sp.]|uniref:CPBP family glutamic-type intramembrane protease n=2 Tax=Anaerorhabdus sp. TaxID=1872524 RepID=UPI002FCA30A7
MNGLLKSESTKLLLLLIFLCLFSLFSVKSNALLILMLFILILSIYFIVKKKSHINRSDILIGGLLMLCCLPTNPILSVFVLPVYVACRVLLKNTSYDIPFLGGFKNSIKTLLCIFLLGGGLSIVNIFLIIGDATFNFNYVLQYFLSALGIGIYEEVLFRLFYFALCIYILKDKKMDKIETILSYLIMVLPHVLLHPGIDLISIVGLSLLFGLPFALMQRKLNLISAMGSHALVDFIRFIVFGG